MVITFPDVSVEHIGEGRWRARGPLLTDEPVEFTVPYRPDDMHAQNDIDAVVDAGRRALAERAAG